MNGLLSRNTITIRTKGSDITSLARMLEADFSKESLRKILSMFITLFDSCNVVSSTAIVSQKVPEILSRAGSKKGEIAEILAALLSSRELLELILDDMGKGAVEVYRAVYKDIYLSVSKAEEICGHSIGAPKKNSGWYSYYSSTTGFELDRDFLMLKCETFDFWTSQSVYLVMPASIRRVLGPLLVPKALDVPVIKEYTPGEGEMLYSVQNLVEPLYPVLHSLYLSGILEMGKSKVTATTLKRISRQASFPEFFPDTQNKTRKNLAGTLMTSIFCLNATNSLSGRKAVADPAHVVAKNIIGFIRNSTAEVLGFYSGLILSKPYQNLFDLPAFSNLIKEYLDILSTYASQDWLMAPGVMAALRNNPDSIRLIIPVNIGQLSHYSIHNVFSGKYLSPFNVITQFTRPLLELLTATLASLGLAEIVYGSPSPDAPSPMNQLKAIRLTPLGRYALGLTDEFSSSLATNGPLFSFDSERLLMQTLGENNPYEVIISKYLTPVGDHRFRATAEKFIDDCLNRKDLERKITNFKILVGDDSLPPLWTAFFNDLLRKSESFRPVTDGYRIFTVNPDDTELVAAITDDPALRDITVCAEGFMLLVKNEHLVRFMDVMRRHGYII